MIELSPYSINILLLFTVIFGHYLLAHFVRIRPFSFFNLYCQRLGDKVNKHENSERQNSISGFIAILVSLPVILVILALFEMFIEVPWLWHALLLFLAMSNSGVAADGKKLAQAIVANHKYNAKQLLSPYVLRDCSSLSNMGMCKAFIEMHIIRCSAQLITTAMIFINFGALSALAYRLLLEMHYCWNTKYKRYLAFGQSSRFIVNLIQWLPSRVFGTLTLMLALRANFMLLWRLTRPSFFRLNNDFLIHCFALINEVKLGGVAIYDGEKLRRIEFNSQGKSPEPSDIIHNRQHMNKTLIFLFMLTATTAIISNLIQ